jgi:hypothetical protein
MTPDEARQKADAILGDQVADLIIAVSSHSRLVYADARKAVADAIAAALLEAAGEWNADMDAAPRDGTRILGARSGGHDIDVIFWTGGNWFGQSNEISMWAAFPPTHWRDLPAPPEQKP